MEVGVGVLGHVVVEDDVDALDVHAATEEVRRHQDPLKRREENELIGRTDAKVD